MSRTGKQRRAARHRIDQLAAPDIDPAAMLALVLYAADRTAGTPAAVGEVAAALSLDPDLRARPDSPRIVMLTGLAERDVSDALDWLANPAPGPDLSLPTPAVLAGYMPKALAIFEQLLERAERLHAAAVAERDALRGAAQ